MFDLSVVAQGGRWILVDDQEGELGAYDTQAEALAAATDYARVDYEPRHVLIHEEEGDWDETLVEPPSLH
jgi:hypothetical protein